MTKPTLQEFKDFDAFLRDTMSRALCRFGYYELADDLGRLDDLDIVGVSIVLSGTRPEWYFTMDPEYFRIGLDLRTKHEAASKDPRVKAVFEAVGLLWYSWQEDLDDEAEEVTTFWPFFVAATDPADRAGTPPTLLVRLGLIRESNPNRALS